VNDGSVIARFDLVKCEISCPISDGGMWCGCDNYAGTHGRMNVASNAISTGCIETMLVSTADGCGDVERGFLGIDVVNPNVVENIFTVVKINRLVDNGKQYWRQEFHAQLVHLDRLSRYWLIPQEDRPKIFSPHPAMTAEEIRSGTQSAWDRFYNLRSIWRRSASVKSLKGRVMYVLVSKLYRQMYANTGIATDSARVSRAATWARWMAKPLRRLFAGAPMPDLKVPI